MAAGPTPASTSPSYPQLLHLPHPHPKTHPHNPHAPISRPTPSAPLTCGWFVAPFFTCMPTSPSSSMFHTNRSHERLPLPPLSTSLHVSVPYQSLHPPPLQAAGLSEDDPAVRHIHFEGLDKDPATGDVRAGVTFMMSNGRGGGSGG